MRYNLRTLVIATAIVPPVLAVVWFYWPIIIGVCFAAVALMLVSAFAVAVCTIPVAVLGYAFMLVAETIIYLGRHPDNRT